MPHVDEGTLHALLDGALRAESPDEADRVETHLRGCEDCRARYDGAAATRDAATAILAGLDVDVTPDFDEVLRRSAAGAGVPQSPDSRGREGGLARQARWTRRAAWAASLVIALGTGYLVGERFGGPGSGARGSLAAPERAETRTLDAEGARPDLDRPARPAAGAAEGAGAGRAEERSAAREPDGAIRREGSPTQARARAPREERPEEGAPRVARAEEEGESAAVPEGDVAAAGDVDVAAAEPAAGLAEDRVAAAEPAESARAGEAAPGARSEEGIALKSAGGEERLLAPSDTSQPIPPPAFADQAVALNALTVTGARPDTIWRSVDLFTARRAVDDSLYILPRAEIQEAFIGPDGRSVRTAQRLSSGVIVEVVQRRAGGAANSDEADRAVARRAVTEAAAPPTPAPQPERRPEAGDTVRAEPPVGGAAVQDTAVARPSTTARATVDGFVLEVTGPIPTELLQILAAAARPLPR